MLFASSLDFDENRVSLLQHHEGVGFQVVMTNSFHNNEWQYQQKLFKYTHTIAKLIMKGIEYLLQIFMK